MDIRFTFVLLAVLSFCISESAIVTNEAEQGKGVLITLGKALVLQCNNTDDPSAKPEWLKDGQPINATDERIKEESSKNSLVIENALESDCGTYTCKSAGQEAIIPVRSLVMLAPVDSSLNVVQNQKIVLLCNVTQGTPLPTMQWLKNNKPLNKSDPRITVITDPRAIKLIINDSRYEDGAGYKCIATNEFSSANATVSVTVKNKYASLWPFLVMCVEIAIVCTIILIYEKRRKTSIFPEVEPESNE